ncbi:MAG: hypothetical protein LAO77_00150 [Acidobacteriia bacterium]|nr:hypothetical protein [Terriglobia bacterium]
MPDFNVRSDSVNVERVMEQIRARIREKRGVDYTEQQIQELANVKLEKILDPRGIRSDLLEQFLKMQPATQPPEVTAEAIRTSKLFDSHRAPIRFVRRLLRPILKLFINPAPLVQVLQGGTRDPLFFELIHNLVVETTRLGIEVKNLKMKVESLTGRLEFNERRARALESVVVYKPSDEPVAPPPAPRPSPAPARSDYYRPPAQTFNSGASSQAASGAAPSGGAPVSIGDRAPQAGGAPFVQGEGPGQRSRRRRRRRGRRSGGGAPGGPSGQPSGFGGGQTNQTNLSGADTAPAPDAPRADPAAEPASEPRPQEPATDSGSSGHEPDSQ